MSRLSELNQKLAAQKTTVLDLAAQAEHSTGAETQRLLRKREQVVLAAQATQNEIDEVLHRVAYLQVAHGRAQENLVALERYIEAIGKSDPLRAGEMAGNRKSIQREIDGIQSEIAKFGALETEIPA
jgi:hypothetical protein